MTISEARKLKVDDVVRLRRYPSKTFRIKEILSPESKKPKFVCEEFSFSHKEIIEVSQKGE